MPIIRCSVRWGLYECNDDEVGQSSNYRVYDTPPKGCLKTISKASGCIRRSPQGFDNRVQAFLMRKVSVTMPRRTTSYPRRRRAAQSIMAG